MSAVVTASMFFGWENFYFLIGSAAAGLFGLLFVVVTLTSGVERSLAMRGTKIYLTPTALNFAAVFTLSTVALVPGVKPLTSELTSGAIALLGFACGIRSCIGIRKPDLGEADMEDFL